MTSLGIALLAVSTAWIFTGLVRRYAVRRALLDHPNYRSSHSTPTPRGGGLGLLATWILGVALMLALGLPGGWPLLLALVGVLAVAVVGWIDDHGGLPVRLRLVAHGLAAAVLLPLVLLPEPLPAWPRMAVVAWWIFCGIAAANVVNFIDGIDGLIGSTALVFGLYAAAVSTPGGTAAACGVALAGSAAGFLFWNWSPARIFLGDVGSNAIGFAFVIVGILLMRETGRGIILTFLPLWPIVLDASVTLIRRWRRGELLTQAHRSHLYQRLANGGWGHARVCLLYGFGALTGAACSAMPPGILRTGSAATYLIVTLLLGVALGRRLRKPADMAVPAKTPSP